MLAAPLFQALWLLAPAVEVLCLFPSVLHPESPADRVMKILAVAFFRHC
jgi:hypothetical protein